MVLPIERQKRILVTGGSGLLGRTLQVRLPGAAYPSSTDLDVTDIAALRAQVDSGAYDTIIHGAALTSPPRVNTDPARAVAVNIVGTANVVAVCIERNIRLLYISTDYVFRGDQGPYAEGDPVLPVNKYAWSKLGGECAVRLHDRSLIVRTSFGPDVFPYTQAMVDQWTSRESVSAIAYKIVVLAVADATGVVHVGGPRRSVYEYARSLDPTREDIRPISVADLPFRVPIDTSLVTDEYERIAAGVKPQST